jgi:hypothetical protein
VVLVEFVLIMRSIVAVGLDEEGPRNLESLKLKSPNRCRVPIEPTVALPTRYDRENFLPFPVDDRDFVVHYDSNSGGVELSGMCIHNIVESESELVIKSQIACGPLSSAEPRCICWISLEILACRRRAPGPYAGDAYGRSNAISWGVSLVCVTVRQ